MRVHLLRFTRRDAEGNGVEAERIVEIAAAKV